MTPLEGRRAVVTGAARGIGRALAEAFAHAGMEVVAVDIDAERLADVERTGIETVVADVSSAADVHRLAAAAYAGGPVHLLCNNVGVVVSGRSWELSLGDWERVLAVDLWGVIHGVREFVPRMLAAGEPGHIVNIASMASVLARPGIAPYSVAKHGVLALGETLGRELHELGAPIDVTTVFPGRVATDLGGDAPAAASDPDLRSAEDVAAQVVAAVHRGDRFLFTHPDRIDEAATRMGAILGRA